MGVRRFAARLAASMSGRRNDARLRDELAEHAAVLTKQYVRSGMPRTRHAARRLSGWDPRPFSKNSAGTNNTCACSKICDRTFGTDSAC